jgi:hypothetical protein
MPTFRRAAALALGAALASLAACADGPTAPSAAPSAAPRRDLAAAGADAIATTPVRGLLWAKGQKPETASKVIGPAGGSLSAGGMKLVVPKGAVAANVTFSVTRLGGRIVAYEFQPHGLVFRAPVQLEFSTKGVDWTSLSGATEVEGAHFLDASALDHATGTAAVTEFAPTVVAVDKSKVTMSVPHFSGWMVSTGRTRE